MRARRLDEMRSPLHVLALHGVGGEEQLAATAGNNQKHRYVRGTRELDGESPRHPVALLRRDLGREIVVLPEHVRAAGHTGAEDAEKQPEPYST